MKHVLFLTLLVALMAPLAVAASGTAARPINGVVNDYPVITANPTSAIVYTTTSKTLSIVVKAATDPTDLPYTCQWSKNGVAIPNTNATALTLTNIAMADAGNYTCTVTSAHGLARVSDPATLTVRRSLTFTKEPWNMTFFIGTTMVLFGEASGEAPITYHWELNGADIAGATSSQYVKSSCQVADGGTYRLVAQDTYGNVLYCTPADITVRPVGAPYPEWKFTHVAGASSASLVINAHDLALQCQTVGTFPNSLSIGNVVKVGVILRVGTTDHVVRADVTLPTDGDSATLTINGANAVDWTGKASPIDLATFAGQVLGFYTLDTLPVLEKRTNNTFVQFVKNGNVLSNNGQYYDW